MTNSPRQTHDPPADDQAINSRTIFRFGLLTAIYAAFVVAFVNFVPELK
jgi:hypothetical protein